MLKIFGRWKKNSGETDNYNSNNKHYLIEGKHRLFDDIVGFDDVKTLFVMAIKAERPVHLLLCGPVFIVYYSL